MQVSINGCRKHLTIKTTCFEKFMGVLRFSNWNRNEKETVSTSKLKLFVWIWLYFLDARGNTLINTVKVSFVKLILFPNGFYWCCHFILGVVGTIVRAMTSFFLPIRIVLLVDQYFLLYLHCKGAQSCYTYKKAKSKNKNTESNPIVYEW